MNGKPQPTEPFLGGGGRGGGGGGGMLWKININNIKQNLYQAAPWPLLQTFICADSHLSSFQILNSVIQKKSILVHFLTNEILRPMHTPMCTSLVNPYSYLVKPATR